MIRAVVGEPLHNDLSAIGHRIAEDASPTKRAALLMLLEQAVSNFLPMLRAIEDSASAREKRAAALKAALADVKWKPENLKAGLGHKSPSSVSRMLTGDERIPDQVYALPDLGPAFHRREGQMFGFEKVG